MSFRIPAGFCPFCRAEISAAWHESGAVPKPLDFTLCASCGSWLVFDDSLRTRKPDREEQERIKRSRNAQGLHQLWVRFMREKKGARTQ